MRYLLILIALLCLVTSSFGQEKLLPVAKNNKWGLVTKNGETVLPTIYDFIEYDYLGKKFIYHLNDKKGIILANGKILSDAIYDDIQFHDSSWASYKLNGFWNVYENEKEWLSNNYLSVEHQYPNHFFLKKEEGYSIFHKKLKKHLTATYSELNVQENVIIGKTANGTYDLISTKDLNLLESELNSINIQSNFLICSKNERQFLFEAVKHDKLINEAISIQFVNSNIFYVQYPNEAGYYILSQNAHFVAPEFERISKLDFPYLFFIQGGKQGVWHLRKSEQLLPPEYEGINLSDGNFYLYNQGNYGIAALDGKVKIETKYASIDAYNSFFVVLQNGKYGLLSSSGKELEGCEYSDIRIYDNKIKCFTDKTLTLINTSTSGQVIDKTIYDEYMSLSFDEPKLPRRKSTSVDFGGDSPAKSNRIAQSLGWFRPDLEKKVKDSIKIVKGNWGLKNDTDSILIRPKYKHIEASAKYGMTKAYYALKHLNSYTIKVKLTPINFTEDITGYYDTPFELIDHENGKKLNQKRFHAIDFNDFRNYSLARGMTKTPCLVDKTGEIIYENLSYHGEYQEDILVICKGGTPKTTKRKSIYNFSTRNFLNRCGLVALAESLTPSTYFSIENGSWYFIDKNGKQLNEEPFQYATPFTKNRSIVKKNGKWGVIDSSMTEIVPIEFGMIEQFKIWDGRTYKTYFEASNRVHKRYLYDRISGSIEEKKVKELKFFYKGRWWMQEVKDGPWALVDTNLNLISEFEYDFVYPFENDLAPVVKRGKRSLINMDGEIMLPFYKAKSIRDIGYDNFAIKQRSGVLVIKANGDTLIQAKNCREVLDNSEDFIVYKNRSKQIVLKSKTVPFKLPSKSTIISYSLKDKVLLIKRKNKTQLYSLSNQKVLLKNVVGAIELGEASILFEQNRKKGLLSFEGDTLIPAKYEDISPVKNGWTFAKEDRYFHIIDKDGKVLDSSEISRFKMMGDNYLVYANRKVGLLSANTEWIIQPNFVKIESYNEKFYKCMMGQNTGFILFDKVGNQLTDKAYKDIKGIDKDGLIVTYKGFDYLYSSYLNEAVSFQDILPVSRRYYILTEKEHIGLFNFDGKEIIPSRYHKIETDRGEFQVRYFNSFGFYSGEGKKIYDPL